MKIATLISRNLLGLAFLIFGLNGFLNFIPQPPPPGGVAGQFVGALGASHYMIPVSALELVAGVLLLANRYVPIALVLLGPIIVNILLFHILMAPGTIAPGIIVTVLFLIVFASVRSAFAGIFAAKVENPKGK
ncbi:hypothetical protein EON80_03935 [bacterium]|nr:MAG: hypothetical protein EON80_03935 [bacterium]